MTSPTLITRAGLGLAALTAALAGCGQTADDTAAPAPVPSSAEAVVSVTDPWVKTADEGMSAVFGVLVNGGDTDVTVVSAATDVSPTELHEVVEQDGEMVMRPKDGGFGVPAGGTHELAPGGDHIMLMDLAEPVEPGDEIAVTLTLSDGTTVAFTALAKDFAGGEESYDPGMGG